MKIVISSVYILVSAALWGCIALFYEGLSALGFSQLQVVFLRVVTAAVFMAGYMLLRDPSWFRIRLKDVWMFIGTGVISLAFFNYCYFSAMDELSPSVAAVLLYTAPVFVMLLSALFFKESITPQKLIALTATLIGCVLVTEVFTDMTVTLWGILLGLGSGIGYALYTIFGVVALRRYRTESITFYTFVFAAVSVLPLCKPSVIIVTAQTYPLETFAGALGIGLLACLLPYLLYTKGLSVVPAGQASVMATLEPVVATVVGVLCLGDTYSLSKLCGMLLIVGAIVLLNVSIGKQSNAMR